jgi:predicted amino acid-binding ACT domain protein
MIILDIPRKTTRFGKYIDIPVYHRTHLGLSHDTTVHYCLLPARAAPSDEVKGSLPELVVAPFRFESWGQLWRLTTSIRDQPGLVHAIAETMARCSVDIIACESNIAEEEGMYHVEMIVSIPDRHTREVLEYTLLSRLLDGIEFLPDGSPRLRLRRVHDLWRVRQSFDRLKQLVDIGAQPALGFKPYVNHAHVELLAPQHGKPRRLRLKLPDEVRSILRDTVSAGDDWGFHLRISDTKNRFLRVLFFRSADAVIHARIEHNDNIGALAKITAALKEGGLNLLTLLSTPSDSRDRAITECVVRSTAAMSAETPAVKEMFERALASSPAAMTLDLNIGYPSAYAEPWDRQPLRHRPTSDQTADEPIVVTSTEDTIDGLHLRRGNLTQRIQSGLATELDVNRWNLVNRLIGRYQQLTRSLRRPVVFISCRFESEQLTAARQLAERLGCEVLTGENLERYSDISSGLVQKIGSCSDFLGIWTETSPSPGSECWPSPWLLWELGAAAGLRINWRLLISSAISKKSWEMIAPAQQHTIFTRENFDTKLEIALAALLATTSPTSSGRLQSHYSEV